MKLFSVTLIFFFLFSFSLQVGTWGYEEENDVVVLTQANHKEFMEKYPTALIEFYAPWCGLQFNIYLPYLGLVYLLKF